MTQQKRFFRKILYIIIIAILIIPLYMMGNPAQRGKDGTLTQGGQLAKMRNDSGLAEVNLGEIDPASSTMKLVTFGMRGVAIALLWNRSLDYEKRADWNNVVTTGNQIIMLEPHFISIWDFVGWKLAYNASAQFDDYRERYRWVILGFDFLQKGTQFNQTDPRLFSKAGWTISQKIGIADEKDQYRRLFREDDDFHTRQVYKERDNWLFGRNYYRVAEDLYEKGGSIGKETRILFYGRSRLNLMHYAEWMEIDGCGITPDNKPLFDEEHAAAAWKVAGEHWADLSKMVLVTTIEDKKVPGQYRKMSLNGYYESNDEIEELIKKLESMLPSKSENRDTIAWKRWNEELTEQQRAALLTSLQNPASADDYSMGESDHPYRVIRAWLDGEHGPVPGWENWQERLTKEQLNFYPPELKEIAEIPAMLRTEAEGQRLKGTEMNIGQWRAQAYQLINVTPEVLTAELVGDAQLEGRDICDRIVYLKEEARFSKMFRDIMDARRHDRKVVVEQQAEARNARDLRYQVRSLYRAGQHEESNRAFLDCMASWKKLLDRPEFSDIGKTPQFVTELNGEVTKYVIVLDQLEKIFPENYPLRDVVANSANYKHTVDSHVKAIDYIQKVLDASENSRARDYAMKMLQGMQGLARGDEVVGLNGIPKLTDSILTATRQWVSAWENIGGRDLEMAKEAGLFDNYPAKQFVELMIGKRDPQVLEAQTESLLATTDPGNALEHYKKAVALWEEIIVRYPILKYSQNSEFRPFIQNTARGYITELKKQELPEPENFSLKDFLI